MEHWKIVISLDKSKMALAITHKVNGKAKEAIELDLNQENSLEKLFKKNSSPWLRMTQIFQHF